MSQIVFFTGDIPGTDFDCVVIVDSFVKYMQFKNDFSVDRMYNSVIYTNQTIMLDFSLLNKFKELVIIHNDAMYTAKLADDKNHIIHNFDTIKELRLIHNLQKMFVAGGVINL